MARDRQRSKQRQSERRARRLAAEGSTPAVGDGARAGETDPVEPLVEDPRASQPAPGIDPNLAVGAPPQDEGQSETLREDETDLGNEDEHLSEEEIDAELEAEQELAGVGESGYEVRGRRGREDAERHKDRPRVVQFLVAVWAELQRVQWPDRQALITLTGVVLGFVLIAGGYLGLLDAAFSELIQAIL